MDPDRKDKSFQEQDEVNGHDLQSKHDQTLARSREKKRKEKKERKA